MIVRIDIQGKTGIPMRAILIPAGETQPNHDVQPDKHELIQFYDSRYDHTPDGQFISEYRTETFLTNTGHGIDLYGSEKDWTIDARTWALVRDWIFYHTYNK